MHAVGKALLLIAIVGPAALFVGAAVIAIPTLLARGFMTLLGGPLKPSPEERARRAAERSLEMEREAGLVFDEHGFLLPGYAQRCPDCGLSQPGPHRGTCRHSLMHGGQSYGLPFSNEERQEWTSLCEELECNQKLIDEFFRRHEMCRRLRADSGKALPPRTALSARNDEIRERLRELDLAHAHVSC